MTDLSLSLQTCYNFNFIAIWIIFYFLEWYIHFDLIYNVISNIYIYFLFYSNIYYEVGTRKTNAVVSTNLYVWQSTTASPWTSKSIIETRTHNLWFMSRERYLCATDPRIYIIWMGWVVRDSGWGKVIFIIYISLLFCAT